MNLFLRNVTVFFFFLIMIFYSFAKPCEAKLIIQAEDGVQPEMITEVQSIANAFDSFVESTLKTHWSEDVQIVIYPNRDAMLSALSQVKPQYTQQFKDQKFYVFSLLPQQTIYLNAAGAGEKKDYERAELLAGFLSHQLTFQLRNHIFRDDLAVESRGDLNYIYWLDDAANRYIGACIAENLKLRPLSKWKQERVERLRREYSALSYNDTQVLAIATWTNFLVKESIAKSDLLAWYFFNVAAPDALPTLAEYHRKASKSRDATAVWSRMYGLTYNVFLLHFHDWYKNEIFLL